MLSKIFSPAVIKSLLYGLSSISVGAVCSSLGSWERNQVWFQGKIVLLIIFATFYVALTIYYTKNDVNSNYAYGILRKRNDAFNVTMAYLMSIFQESSNGIDIIAKNIIEMGKIDLNIWSFNKACFQVCRTVYEFMKTIAGEGNKIEVTYVKYLDEKPGYIMTIGYSGYSKRAPNNFNKPRKIDDDRYYDTKMFRKENPEVVVFDSSKDIDANFDCKESGKYCQYIGVPVFSNGKMIGLLQIVAREKSNLAKNATELRELADCYLTPISALFEFLVNVEKGLLAQPKLKSAVRSRYESQKG